MSKTSTLITLGLILWISPLTLAAANDSAIGPCYDVPEYNGINAIPAISMQIHPSSGGDTVTNDAEYPPGEGAKVVVGFWEHPEDYDPEAEGENPNPCEGEPTMKLAYPIDHPDTCYGWKHWVVKDGELDLHPNSAKHFSCDSEGTFNYNQWTTMTCDPSREVGEEGTPKSAHRLQCCRDFPPTIYSMVLSGCGKEPPGADAR